MGLVSLQIQDFNNADVLLDSGLKSGNYIVYLLKWTSALDFKKLGCVIQI